jgi:hypothetical protein
MPVTTLVAELKQDDGGRWRMPMMIVDHQEHKFTNSLIVLDV